LFAILFLPLACDDNDDSTDCSYVKSMAAPSACYDAKAGLTLTASGTETEGKDYLWQVWALKKKTDGISSADAKTNYGSLEFTLNDAELVDQEQVIARITTNCHGNLMYSLYFKFSKVTTGNCTTWSPEE
jgi:hypothetical protein